eukprot:m.81990 g.81990  ORF g.81990 m.81990 type:complete len:416 (+) comp17604_c0_seq3:187-1434(+)
MPSTKSDYSVLETIGTGTFGVCRKIRRKSDGKVLVWKELDYGGMNEKEKQMLVAEVNILREMRHPHIVRYIDRIIDREHTTIYIIMEYCQGGDLASLIKKRRRQRQYLEEEFIWKVFQQLASAMQECHQRKGDVILHRDLKPANIFLDSDNNAKLGDFGLARVLKNTAFAKTVVGTPYYMSPEQINEHAYNEKSDIWSLGCLVYELASLAPPFEATTQAALAAKINHARFHPLPAHYSPELTKIVRLMLQRDPSQRPSIDHLVRHQPPQSRPRHHSGSADGSVSSSSGESPLGARCVSCDRCEGKLAVLRAREDELRAKEEAVHAKEEDMRAREARLAQREQLLLDRERQLAALESRPSSAHSSHALGSYHYALRPSYTDNMPPLHTASKDTLYHDHHFKENAFPHTPVLYSCYP